MVITLDAVVNGPKCFHIVGVGDRTGYPTIAVVLC